MGFGEYLGSRRNLVGTGFGAGALAATALAGVLWPVGPVAAAAAYGIAAFLTPKSEGGAGSGPTSAQQAAGLSAELKDLAGKMSYKAAHLPPDVNSAWDRVRESLKAILVRHEQLAKSPHQLFTVSRSIRDYVPTAIDAYLALPQTYATGHRVRGGRTAHEELLYQLGLLGDELERVRDAVYAGDAQALADHGRFLEDKFSGSGLAVPAEALPEQDRAALDAARAREATQSGGPAGPAEPNTLQPPKLDLS